MRNLIFWPSGAYWVSWFNAARLRWRATGAPSRPRGVTAVHWPRIGPLTLCICSQTTYR